MAASLALVFFNEEEISQLAREYESRGELSESITILNLALELLPNPILVYDDLGRNHLKVGNKAKAMESYETLLKKFPQYKSARETLKQLKK